MVAVEPALVIRLQSAATLCMSYKAALALVNPLVKRYSVLCEMDAAVEVYVIRQLGVRVEWKLIGLRDVDVILTSHGNPMEFLPDRSYTEIPINGAEYQPQTDRTRPSISIALPPQISNATVVGGGVGRALQDQIRLREFRHPDTPDATPWCTVLHRCRSRSRLLRSRRCNSTIRFEKGRKRSKRCPSQCMRKAPKMARLALHY